jgi:hypothetical protein
MGWVGSRSGAGSGIKIESRIRIDSEPLPIHPQHWIMSLLMDFQQDSNVKSTVLNLIEGPLTLS